MVKYQDAIIAAVLLGFAGFYAYEVSKISGEDFQRAAGIVYYPLLLTVSLGVASLLLLVKSLTRPEATSELGGEGETDEGSTMGSDEAKESESEGQTETGLPVRTLTGRTLPVLLGIVILAAYVLALSVVGFIAATPVMLVALLLAYGVRNWKVIASLAIGIMVVVYVIFYYLLNMQLP